MHGLTRRGVSKIKTTSPQVLLKFLESHSGLPELGSLVALVFQW